MKRISALFLVLLLVLTAVFAGACAPAAKSETPQTAAATTSQDAPVTQPAATQTAAAQTATTSSTPSTASEAGSQKWIDSDIQGSVTAATAASASDDFNVFVNKDWLSENQIKAGDVQGTSFHEQSKTVVDKLTALLGGKEQSDPEAKKVQLLYKQLVDMDARNKAGMDPVMPYIKEIQKLKTIDDLKKFMMEETPLSNSLFTVSTMADFKDSSKNAVYIGETLFTLSDADEYKDGKTTSVGERKKQAYTSEYTALLQRVGYTADEASKLIDSMFAFESKIAAKSFGSSDTKKVDYVSNIYNPVTIDELRQLSPNYPIAEVLKPFIDAGAKKFILMDKEWLKALNEVYTKDNIDAIKAYYICHTLGAAVQYLDQKCLDISADASATLTGTRAEQSPEQSAYSTCSSLMSMAVGKLYAENCFSEKTKKDIESMIDKVIAVYKARLSKTEWLSEATREKAIEKLDNLRIRVGYPDDWSKYATDGLKLRSNKDGGTILDNISAISAFTAKQIYEKCGKPIDLDYWLATPQTINAYYQMTDNSINIPAAILGGVFYDENGTVAGNMGGIGMVIGHEITHAFDTRGSQYDKDGNLSNWWTAEDSAAFAERTKKVSDYFGSIQVLPGKNVDGELVVTEAVADLGGVSCMLEIAKNIKDFDYDDFFTSFARIWRCQNSQQVEEILLQDSHPPGYLRTNVNVQQFSEFYDTFGIKEGDPMYLAPEKRLSVW